uniref:Cadherin domain-containing protein n=1 Tax=Mola mola TaxID=94237 RepID=A0A3Q3VNJ4_MOLML
MEQRKRKQQRVRGYLFACVVAVLLWTVASAQIRYSISEEVNEGTVVGNAAKDLGLDKSTLEDRKFRIVSDSQDPLFHVNGKDGILYVSRRIDREAVCAQSAACLINLKTVLENPLEIHYVEVEVLDINDHSPLFPEKDNILEISESVLPGARFQLKASRDPDSGHFSVQQYKLSQNDHFRLEVKDRGKDGKIPILVIQKSLDRETAGSHSLVLTALDGGKPPKSGNMNILVNVLDINDNAPVFSKDDYSVTLKENTPAGTTVIQVNATDLDDGSNGNVVYSLSKSMDQNILNLFVINHSTGEVIVKGSRQSQYDLIITAIDAGQPPLSSEMTISVVVSDVNDNSPEFSLSPYTFYVTEGNNGSQENKLTSFLNINSENGDILALKSFDFETVKTFQFQVVATDAGTPSLSSNVTVNVFILDQNDNAPVILYPVSSNGSAEGVEEIPRNVNAGHLVTKVRAYDADIGYNGWLLFSLQEVTDHSLFGLDRYTGQIRTLRSFTETDEAEHKLVILVKDNGNVSLSATATVTVKVVEPGTTVALISLNDLDSGLNGKVICSLDEDVPFTLSPTLKDKIYSLVTMSTLDREQKVKFDLTIVAKDAGQPPLSSERTISVVVSDVNDNSPEFLLSPYTFYISEGNEPGQSVFSVKAFDQDENNNAHISYHILRDGRQENKLTSFLNINSENGDILALKSFDFEAVKTFQFQVVATDAGTPSLSSNATVNVFILDQNDNAPVILYPVSSNGSAEGVEEIPRNVNAGHLVTKVRAYDADIGYNGWLLFSLQEVTDHKTDEAEHKLVILVKDNGNVSLSATATVTVKVVEPKEAFAASDVKSSAEDDDDSNVTFYLMITLGSVSVLFIISIIVLIWRHFCAKNCCHRCWNSVTEQQRHSERVHSGSERQRSSHPVPSQLERFC